MHVEVSYGGDTYAVPGRPIEDVQQQIDDIIQSGRPGWIEAFDGHGSRVPFRLLITSGVPVSLAQLQSE